MCVVIWKEKSALVRSLCHYCPSRKLTYGPRIALACAKFADSLDAETVEAIPQKSVRIIAVDLIALPRTEECCDADDADDAEDAESRE